MAALKRGSGDDELSRGGGSGYCGGNGHDEKETPTFTFFKKKNFTQQLSAATKPPVLSFCH